MIRKYVRPIAYALSLVMLATTGSLRAQIGGGIDNSGGVGVAGTNVWTGDNRFTDSLFFLRDDGDLTKLIQFQASGITAGNTRTLTVPNASGTLALLSAQTFTGTQTIPDGTVGAPGLALSGTGLYSPSSGYIAWGNGSVGHYTMNSAVTRMSSAMDIGWTPGTDALAAVTDTSFSRLSAGVIKIKLGQSSTAFGALALASIAPETILRATGSAPTVSACGSSPSAVTGSNTAGRLTTGSGAALQSCTITFVPALATAPSCVANNETNILLVRAVATATTLVIDSAVAGTLESDVVNFLCIGGS